jgi:nicotinate dehydrogenase subunit A
MAATESSVKQLNVNGRQVTVDADAERSLLFVLRDDLGLTGSKYGCGEGRCGACTVLIDGRPTRSCTTRVGTVAGKEIRTIESIADGEKLHAVQQAFLEAGAMQCGYCTSGMIMSAVALLDENPKAQRDDIIRYMNGHICRCGVYGRVVEAIEQVASRGKGGAT